ncbi:MAG TPA: DUF4384 domain-containing protein, partial [Bacteroidales bacterium]|nr:DUF4384 domain-containing protein [Bacteroidales bacterium]
QLMAQPKWIDAQWRKAQYPDALYLTGYASEQNKLVGESELLSKLEGFAKSRLSESILVSISSLVDIHMTETNKQVEEYVRKNCISNSNIVLAGSKTEQYYDKKTKTAYVLVYAKKEEVSALYKKTIDDKVAAIDQIIEMAQQLESNGDKAGALKMYYQTQVLFREAEEAQTIYLALQQKLNDDAAAINRLSDLSNTVEKAIFGISNSKNLNIEDACYLMAQAYQMQTGNITADVRLVPFTYQDTKMSSPFSQVLLRKFEQSLISEAQYAITLTGKYEQGMNQPVEYFISGTYWEEGEFIKIMSVMRDKNNRAIASSESTITKHLLDSLQIEVKPENFEEAYSRMKVFKQDEIIHGDLMVEVWTNHGDENLIFSEGDNLRLYVRVNKECYLRFIYHLADGNIVMLLDNYFVNADKVNKVYELPYDFVCAEPFGVEVLQLNAQTEKFTPLNLHNSNGYQFITDALVDVIHKTRGIKRNDNTLMQAEKRLVITTMPE